MLAKAKCRLNKKQVKSTQKLQKRLQNGSKMDGKYCTAGSGVADFDIFVSPFIFIRRPMYMCLPLSLSIHSSICWCEIFLLPFSPTLEIFPRSCLAPPPLLISTRDKNFISAPTCHCLVVFFTCQRHDRFSSQIMPFGRHSAVQNA